MATYVRRNTPTIEAFTITEVSPEFHGHMFCLLDDGRVIDAIATVGDYYTAEGVVAKDPFEAEWMPA